MAKNPKERFQSAAELAAALHRCQKQIKIKRKSTKRSKVYLEESPEAPVKEIVEKIQKEIRILVVDDSPMLCKAISKTLEKIPGFQVVGIAYNGSDALKKLPELDPDVITLDFNMPVMDGISTLKHIMIRFPRPVIMLSAFTYEGAFTSFDCLFYGAVDFIWKTSRSQFQDFKKEFVAKIKRSCLH